MLSCSKLCLVTWVKWPSISSTKITIKRIICSVLFRLVSHKSTLFEISKQNLKEIRVSINFTDKTMGTFLFIFGDNTCHYSSKEALLYPYCWLLIEQVPTDWPKKPSNDHIAYWESTIHWRFQMASNVAGKWSDQLEKMDFKSWFMHNGWTNPYVWDANTDGQN